ncbi:migration and invasion-inhibitory protein [Discoglossus pictus]
MSASVDLEELRRVNKDLLERLKVKCEEFKKCVPDEGASIPGITKKIVAGTGHPTMDRPSNRQNKQTLISTQGKVSTARQALCTPIKPSLIYKENPVFTCQKTGQNHQLSLKKQEKTGKEAKNVVIIKSPVKRVDIRSFSEDIPDNSCELGYMDHLTDEGNMRTRDHTAPRSILITPKNKDAKREYGRVTFGTSTLDNHCEQWSTRPFLGYDWIAGILELDSPITNKSEEFFSEINEFRRVNREECAQDYYTPSDTEDLSTPGDELDLSLDTHECVYCYRVNNRLFTSPVGPESACPICKKRRAKRHPTVEEPAYIRVSIPRSTLLPPYKYKAHRRKSFDPTDSLALPSHCLAGWENAAPSCEANVTSLDLKASLDPGTAPQGAVKRSSEDVSLYALRTRSETLLNMSRSIHFHHGKAK